MSKFDTFQNTQGSIIKRVCGIPKRSHHTQLLRALDITDVDSILEKSITSLYFRIFKLDNPLRDLCTYDLSVYMSCGHTIPGTITHRILQLGLSPIDCAFKNTDRAILCAMIGLSIPLDNLFTMKTMQSHGQMNMFYQCY